MEDTIGIETILVIPRRPDRFQYKINDGKNHMCDEDSLRKLINPLLDENSIEDFLDVLHRLRIFALVVSDKKGKIIELKPKNTKEIEKTALSSALKSEIGRLRKAKKVKKKQSEDDKLSNSIDSLFEKVLN